MSGKKKRSVKAFAPATVANVACGYDIFGFAIEMPGDHVKATLLDDALPGLTFDLVNSDKQGLPLDHQKNTAFVAAKALLDSLDEKNLSLAIELEKQMPLGSGLGSSAASAVAAAVALNDLLGSPYKKEELLPFVLEGERAACGYAHADNVAPSLLGGFTLIRSYDPLEVIFIDTPEELFAVVASPNYSILTEEARRVLPQKVALEDMVTQTGNAAALIAGLMGGDFSLIARALQDVIVEPSRAHLIPSYEKVKEAALEAGALGCNIAGSGASVFAFCTSLESGAAVASAISESWMEEGIENEVYASGINKTGAEVVDEIL